MVSGHCRLFCYLNELGLHASIGMFIGIYPVV